MQGMKLGLAVCAAVLWSAPIQASELKIEHASLRATAPGQQTAMADMSITSKQMALLVSVTTPIAEHVEMHVMKHDNGMMEMREVKTIPLPPARTVKLSEEGYHLMLMGLKQPVKEGASVPFTLTFQLENKKRVTLETNAAVKPLVAFKAEADDHEHLHHH